MITRATEYKKLEELFGQSGNQLYILYGREGCGKELLLQLFTRDKKCFYYHARNASAEEQLHQMQQLCIGKLLRRQRGRHLRAAVAAAQVAALGQREPQAMDITVCLIIHSFGLLVPRLRGCFYACRMPDEKSPCPPCRQGLFNQPSVKYSGWTLRACSTESL